MKNQNIFKLLILLISHLFLFPIKTTAQVAEVIGGLSVPYGLALDQANRLYISQSGNINGNKISFILLTDANPILSDVFTTNLNTPTKLKLSSDNFLYVSESDSNFGRISRANMGGTSTPVMTNYYSTELSSPVGIDVVGNNLFIGDFGNFTIKKVNTSISPFQSTILAFDLATDIIINGDFIYYANPTSAEVKSTSISSPATIPSSITSGIANPSSLLLNNGILYVSDSTNGKIYRCNILAPSINADLIASGLNQPQSMVLFNNELYIAESGANRIVKLNISNLSNENFHTSFSLSVYPNPVQNILNIQTQEIIKEIAVYYVLGKKVAVSQVSTNSINVSNLAQGMYIVKVMNDNDKSFSTKFIKE